MLGENGRSAVGTLVERSSRFVLVLHLRDGRAAVSVEAALKLAIANLPSGMCRSITWDQGAEMSTHAAFIAATDVPIYFYDAHSPWQRGSSENTNGVLRQYLPKGTTCPSTPPPTFAASKTASTTDHAEPLAT